MAQEFGKDELKKIIIDGKDHSKINFQKLPRTLFTRVNQINPSLQNVRIIQKNLVYLIGLSSTLLKQDQLLKNFEFLGQYGNIQKFVINKTKTYNQNGPNGPSYSCYVTYSSAEESSLAILALDNMVVDNHVIKASYGTTKYCTNFLRNSICQNKECLFLHHIAEDKDIVSRDEMNSNKMIFNKQHIMAIEVSKILTKEKKEELSKIRKRHTSFPNAFNVYNKEIVVEYIKNYGNIFNDNSGNASSNNSFQSCKTAASSPKLSKIKKKKYISLLKLLKYHSHSRFDFANAENANLQIDVPFDVSNFILESLIENTLERNNENDDINEYYFSKAFSNDSNDSWSSLISTLQLCREFDNDGKKPHEMFENDDFIVVQHFNTR